MLKTRQEIEGEFEEKFPAKGADIPPDRFRTIIRIDNGMMKSHINQIRLSDLTAVEEMVNKLKLPAHNVVHPESCIECKEIRAYNAGLDDLLSSLLEIKKTIQ